MSTIPVKGRSRGRPRTDLPGQVVVQVKVGERVHAALERAAAIGRRTKNAELAIALEEHLAALGLWRPLADPA